MDLKNGVMAEDMLVILKMIKSMDSAPFTGKIIKSVLDVLRKGKFMELGLEHSLMEVLRLALKILKAKNAICKVTVLELETVMSSIMETLRKGSSMDLAFVDSLMETDTRVNSKAISLMEKKRCITVVEKFLKEIGKMIRDTGKEG